MSEYITLYDRRHTLVADAVKQHSKLSDKASADLARHVLEALDHIPATVR
jgi:Family of unknown function (DUF6307)